MEFINIGGGEILVIILLAIILFGPEDILRIMRTIGGYVRKVQRMWAQVSAGLKGEFLPDEIIPEEIRETIKETKASVDDVKATLNEVQTTVQTDIDDTKATVNEVKESLKDVDTTVKSDLREIPQSLRATAKDAVKTKEVALPENEPDPESVQLIAALLDDSSGSNSDEPADETESTTKETATTSEESDEIASETVEAAETTDPDETTSPIDANIQEITPPATEAPTDDDPHAKTVALIASLLESKSKDTGDEGIDDESEIETAPTAESADLSLVPESLAEPAPEVVAEPVDATPISPSEPVTTEAPQNEEV